MKPMLLGAMQAVQKSAEWQVGTYVRVHGSMSEFNNVHRVQAFNVRAITDFNEVRPCFRAGAGLCRAACSTAPCMGRCGRRWHALEGVLTL